MSHLFLYFIYLLMNLLLGRARHQPMMLVMELNNKVKGAGGLNLVDHENWFYDVF